MSSHRDRSPLDKSRRSPSSKGKAGKWKVEVSQFPPDTPWTEVRSFFRLHVGDVVGVDPKRLSRGITIVEFPSSNLVDKAVNKINNFEYKGKKLIVKKVEDRVTKVPDLFSVGQNTDRIFVSNIPTMMDWIGLREIFSKNVGKVIFAKVFFDENNQPRGCGIVRFSSDELAREAVRKMNGMDVQGHRIYVQSDVNIERDNHGNVVNLIPELDRSEKSSKVLTEADFGQTYGLSINFLLSLGIDGPLHTKIFATNLEYTVDEKKIYDVFRLAGKIACIELLRDKDGKSKGMVRIEYSHPVEAVQAISMFDNQKLNDRTMHVRPEKNAQIEYTLPDLLPDGLAGVGVGLGDKGCPLIRLPKRMHLEYLEVLYPPEPVSLMPDTALLPTWALTALAAASATNPNQAIFGSTQSLNLMDSQLCNNQQSSLIQQTNTRLLQQFQLSNPMSVGASSLAARLHSEPRGRESLDPIPTSMWTQEEIEQHRQKIGAASVLPTPVAAASVLLAAPPSAASMAEPSSQLNQWARGQSLTNPAMEASRRLEDHDLRTVLSRQAQHSSTAMDDSLRDESRSSAERRFTHREIGGDELRPDDQEPFARRRSETKDEDPLWSSLSSSEKAKLLLIAKTLGLDERLSAKLSGGGPEPRHSEQTSTQSSSAGRSNRDVEYNIRQREPPTTSHQLSTELLTRESLRPASPQRASVSRYEMERSYKSNEDVDQHGGQYDNYRRLLDRQMDYQGTASSSSTYTSATMTTSAPPTVNRQNLENPFLSAQTKISGRYASDKTANEKNVPSGVPPPSLPSSSIGLSATMFDTVMVSNLPDNINWQDLGEAFTIFGGVKSAIIKQCGTGLVRFVDQKSAEAALSFDKTAKWGRIIRVQIF